MRIGFSSSTKFVIILGVVSLFSDVTYEGARSLNGQFLQYLGATARTVGIVAGLGELIGYALRLFTGFLSDKTKKYWLFTIVGYFVNLLAVPMLAFALNIKFAIFLIILERIGKAIRTPSRDVMLSYAGSQIGSGWAFGLHEAMDQIGATLGPLFVALAFYLKGDVRSSYLFLFFPAFIAIFSLFLARIVFKEPKDFIKKEEEKVVFKNFNKDFYAYIIAVSLVAAGFIDFPLIAYHMSKNSIVPLNFIPLFYSIAMISDAFSAIIFGKLFDKFGYFALFLGFFIALLFPPLVFLREYKFVIFGMVFWGVGMGIQESILRAQIAKFVSPDKRGSAFGIFNSLYGFSWFLGSAIIGFLYDYKVLYVVVFSVTLQLIALLILIRRRKG